MSAPTREEVRDLLRTFTSAVVEGESLYSNTPLPERRKQLDASREALLAAFDDLSRRIDAIAAERDAALKRCGVRGLDPNTLRECDESLTLTDDPRIKAWRAMDAEERAYSTRRLAIAGRLGEVAAAALEALGEKP